MKNLCKLTLAAGVLLGAVRLADLIFFTNAETGFVTVGGPLMRYIAFSLAAVLALAAGAAVPAAASPRAATAKTAPLWWEMCIRDRVEMLFPVSVLYKEIKSHIRKKSCFAISA